MDNLPTKEQLVKELGSLLRYGLGRPPRGLAETDVRSLAELSARLVDDPDEEWPLRIARAVAREITAIPQVRERLAIADIFGVELVGDQSADVAVDQIIEDIESGLAVAPLEGPKGRYDEAGQRFRDARRPKGYSERYVKDDLRKKWLEQVADRLLKQTRTMRAAIAGPSRAPLASPLTGAADAEMLNDDSSWIVKTSAASAELYYAALVTLFAYDFISHDSDRHRYLSRDAWDSFGGYLFDWYAGFYAVLTRILEPAEKAAGDVTGLSSSKRTRLRSLLDLAEAHDPFDRDREPPPLSHYAGFTTDEHAQHYRLLATYGLIHHSTGSKARYTLINDLYETVWMDWYATRLGSGRTVTVPLTPCHQGVADISPIETMAEVGLQVHRELSPLCAGKTGRAAPTVARHRAAKTIACYAEVDEWVPAIDGQSLRSLVDLFFDHKGTYVTELPV